MVEVLSGGGHIGLEDQVDGSNSREWVGKGEIGTVEEVDSCVGTRRGKGGGTYHESGGWAMVITDP